MFCIYTHPVNSKSTIWQYRKEICTIHILLYMYKYNRDGNANIRWLAPKSDYLKPISSLFVERIHLMFDPFDHPPRSLPIWSMWTMIKHIRHFDNVGKYTIWYLLKWYSFLKHCSTEWGLKRKIGKKHISLISLMNIQEKLS